VLITDTWNCRFDVKPTLIRNVVSTVVPAVFQKRKFITRIPSFARNRAFENNGTLISSFQTTNRHPTRVGCFQLRVGRRHAVHSDKLTKNACSGETRARDQERNTRKSAKENIFRWAIWAVEPTSVGRSNRPTFVRFKATSAKVKIFVKPMSPRVCVRQRVLPLKICH
jgi:hypothetical protein